MQFNQFLQLHEDEQIEILWYNGQQVARRRQDDYLVLLYQVESFYVELYYHIKTRVIKRYLSFEDTSKLEPYLQTIDLTSVHKQIRKSSKGRDFSFADAVINDAFSHRTTENSFLTKLGKKKLWSKISFWEVLFSLFRKQPGTK